MKTKTAVQIRSHAQKFFSKLEKQQKQLQAGLQPTISERRALWRRPCVLPCRRGSAPTLLSHNQPAPPPPLVSPRRRRAD